MFELKPTRSFKLPWSKLLQMIGVAREGHKQGHPRSSFDRGDD